MTTTPSSRPRNGRRESTASTATGAGRVRKNSIATSVGTSVGSGSMRPRANTISHIDNATLGMMAAANPAASRHDHLGLAHNTHGFNAFQGPGGYEFRGMSTAMGHHGNSHGLPKLETHGLHLNLGGGLRTAPPFGGFEQGYDMGNMLFGPGNTINPAQLHFSDSPHALTFDAPTSPYPQGFLGLQSPPGMIDEDGNFEWMSGFDHHMSFDPTNEHAIAGSSPSAISTGSPSGISEVMIDGSNPALATSGMWQTSVLSQAPMVPEYTMDMTGSTFPDLSPKEMQDNLAGNDQAFSHLNSQSPLNTMHGMPSQFCPTPVVANPDTPTNSADSGSSSNRQSSVTSVSADSITDATRQALLISLSQPSAYTHNHRKYSQPTISSPLSPGFSTRPRSVSNISLPSTFDLQRYVAAYVQYFHPHFPFLHVPSLSFNSSEYTNNIRLSNGHPSFHHPGGIVGGGGCLILAMAAIGALYEYDTAASKELFESAKRMIQLYLEERRKADMSAAVNGSPPIGDNSIQNTPLWLVQAMLLNVIYGHNCGDKLAANIANTHCASLVSLARAAELAQPYVTGGLPQFDGDISMAHDGWQINALQRGSHEATWHTWKVAEERKRTLYAIFILSSMLVSAYNHAPALTNSEIRLDLPCEEDMWTADSAEAWVAMGGMSAIEQKIMPFSSALSSLLTASQRQKQHQQHMPRAYCQQRLGSGFPPSELPPADFEPSTFGCLVLINALHNYIWETRQRHLGRPWTTQETESMHAHIEPALVAWQAAWASNPRHSLERPNPFGSGPLSADSVPLLDLAYVRLFVNLGRSKEAFWQWDFDGMAEEIARGSEIVQHADDSSAMASRTYRSSTPASSTHGGLPVDTNPVKQEHDVSLAPSVADQLYGKSSKRERHLRKAAYHAAHSLSMADKLGVTFADFNSRELPMQSAMCAFDCAQVLAEWISTVQERVGRHIGILGKDNIDYDSVPAVMYVDTEDTTLFAKVDEVLSGAEVKMAIDNGSLGVMDATRPQSGLPDLNDCCYGSKILMVTAYMLKKSAVWPGQLVLFVCSWVSY